VGPRLSATVRISGARSRACLKLVIAPKEPRPLTMIDVDDSPSPVYEAVAVLS
jgi:hypothetical protein